MVHSDIGAPMKGETMQRRGGAPSRRRPSVSGDIPCSDTLFCSFKHGTELTVNPFKHRLQARRWVTEVVHWSNGEHRLNAIGFVTPTPHHGGQDRAQQSINWPVRPAQCISPSTRD